MDKEKLAKIEEKIQQIDAARAQRIEQKIQKVERIHATDKEHIQELAKKVRERRKNRNAELQARVGQHLNELVNGVTDIIEEPIDENYGENKNSKAEAEIDMNSYYEKIDQYRFTHKSNVIVCKDVDANGNRIVCADIVYDTTDDNFDVEGLYAAPYSDKNVELAKNIASAVAEKYEIEFVSEI